MISTLQISVVLDYGKVYFKRTCKGIKINELLLHLGSGSHGDRRQGFSGVTESFTMVNDR